MSLPVPPPLDPRTIDDIVTAAKSAVRRELPQWAGIDGPDAGTALVEACAAMAVALARRLNQAPDKARLAVLKNLGVRPRPAAPARTDVAFTLTVARTAPVEIPSGTRVVTEPQGSAAGVEVSFTTTRAALLYSCTLLAGGLFRGEHYMPESQTFTGTLTALGTTSNVSQSSKLLAVLSGTVPDTQITLDFPKAVDSSAVGLKSTDWVWEVWAGTRWEACGLVEDTTTGLTRGGHVVLRIPSSHAPTTVELNRGTDTAPQLWRAEDVGLLRCTYPGSAVFTVPLPAMTLSTEMSVLVPVVQADVVDGTLVGVSTGRPGQRFALPSQPLLDEGRITAEIALPGQVPQLWEHVRSLSAHSPDDQVFWIDPTTGEAVFGLQVLNPDGVRRYGAIPPENTEVRITRYLTGGGSAGNVPARAISVLRDPLPPISRVSNPSAATGGADQESADAFAARVPLGRAGERRVVTAADMEDAVRSTPTGVLRVLYVAAGKGELLTPFREVAFWTPAASAVRFANPGKASVTVPAGTQVGATALDGTPIVFTTTYQVSVDPGSFADVVVTQQKTVPAGTEIKGGVSNGTPGQRVRLTDYPITGTKPKITVITPNAGSQVWTGVETFAASGPSDQHVMINASTGEVCFGIGEYGAIPVAGSTFAVGSSYQATVGGGGNVAVGAITQCDPGLKLTVVNNVPARDGANGSSVVTPSAGPYGLLVVPALPNGPGTRLNYNDLVPSPTLRDNVARVLRPLMPPGTTVGVHAPGYQGVGVDATVVPADFLLPSERAALKRLAEDALHAYFNPVGGGPDGTGWPFGRPVHLGDAYAVLDRLPGVAEVRDPVLYPVNPVTGDRGRPADRIDVTDLSTVFSVGHRVTVYDPSAAPAATPAPATPAATAAPAAATTPKATS